MGLVQVVVSAVGHSVTCVAAVVCSCACGCVLGFLIPVLYHLWRSFLVDDRPADRILTYQEGRRRAYIGVWLYYHYTWFCI